MKYLVTSLFFINILFSQTELDSLFSSITSKHDSIKIKMLSEYSWNNRNSHPIDALSAGKEALVLANKHQDNHMIATINNYLGVIYRNIGSIENAIQYFYIALKIAKQSNDSLQIAYSYNNIGGIYRIQNNYTLALENILNALKIFEKLNDKSGAAYCSINLGIIFFRQKDYDKALDYLNKTVEIREQINDEWGKAVALNHIAELHFERGELELAQKYFHLLKDLYSKNGDVKGISAAYSGLSGVYFKQQKFKEAEKSRLQAIEIAKSIQFVDGLILGYGKLSLIYAQMNKTDLGLKYLDSTKSLIQKYHRRDMLLSYYNVSAEFYKIKHDYKTVVDFMQKYNNLKDTLTSEENKLWMGEIETIYNVEKNQKEMELLSAELKSKQTQRNYLIVILLMGIILGGVVISKYYNHKRTSKKFQKINQEKDKLFRILAHDLKNPFNSLLGLSEMLKKNFENFNNEEKIEAINEINKSSTKLYELVKNLLDWVKAQNEGLIANIQPIDINCLLDSSFDPLMNEAKNKNIKITKSIEDNIQIESDYDTLQTIIRNIISNSIKFTRQNGVINFSVNKVNQSAVFNIKDNGVGMNDAEVKNLFELNEGFTKRGTLNEPGTGIGLVIVKELVDKLKGKIEVKSQVEVGTEFIISIPLKYEI